MRANPLKSAMRAGRSVLGTFVHLADPSVVEIAGAAELDFVIIDMEHSPKDLPTVENMVRAAEAFGITSLVRVHANEEKTILRVLETGAMGIVLPLVESADDVRRALDALCYPPEGRRGTCTVTRAARYGAFRSEFARHARDSNRELMLVGLIESGAGIERIDEIIAAGLEVAFVGRADLAAELGVVGEPNHPTVLAAVGRVLDAVRSRQNRWGGILCYRPDEYVHWAGAGFRVFTHSVDTRVLLDEYAAAAVAFREAVAALDVSPV